MEAWERFHKVECQQLDLILDPTVGKMGMLAMRILTSSGKIYLEYVIAKLREEADARQEHPGYFTTFSLFLIEIGFTSFLLLFQRLTDWLVLMKRECMMQQITELFSLWLPILNKEVLVSSIPSTW